MPISAAIRAVSWSTWISLTWARSELLRTLAASQAALPAIITSRHLKRRAPVGGLPPGRILFLDKPFGIDELLRLIRIALASASGSQPGS